LPFISTSTKEGILNFAFVPVPSSDPEVVCPASVVTTPNEVILRMQLLLVSATYTFPYVSTATPEGFLNSAFVPVPSIYPNVLLPANVLTVTTGESNRSILVTANVAAVRLALVDTSPIVPHASITLEGFVSVKEEASHFTQDETVKGDEPVGRLDNRGVERYDPLETTNAAVGKEVEFE
jgi:hypothetical protein